MHLENVLVHVIDEQDAQIFKSRNENFQNVCIMQNDGSPHQSYAHIQLLSTIFFL